MNKTEFLEKFQNTSYKFKEQKHIQIVPDNSIFYLDRIHFTSYSYGENKSVCGFNLNEFKTLFNILKEIDKLKNAIIIHFSEESSINWNNYFGKYRYHSDNETEDMRSFNEFLIKEYSVGGINLMTFTHYDLDTPNTKNIYSILNFFELLEETPLSEFESRVQKTLLKKLILNKYCRLEKEDYPTAKKIYLEGRAEFMYLFGKDRIPIPNSEELYELIQSPNFFSTKKQAMNGNSILYGNIVAVFNYHFQFFNEDICNFFISIMKDVSVNRQNQYSREAATSMEVIIQRFKKGLKKNKDTGENLPDYVKLLLEIE